MKNEEESGEGVEVPYHLMPVAAVLGTYAVFASIKAVYEVYRWATHSNDKKGDGLAMDGTAPPSIRSRRYLLLLVSIVVSVAGYGHICARVNDALSSAALSGGGPFDPFEILQLDPSSSSSGKDDASKARAAYRTLSKIHHPDKGGDPETFQRLNLAYRTLTDSTARANWEMHGHPDGAAGASSASFRFALPPWLLHPQGNVALVLILSYLSMFVFLATAFVRYVTRTEREHKKTMLDNSVAGADMAYLSSRLRPDSTHLQILFYVATCPEMVELSRKNVEKAQQMREERLQKLKEIEKREGKLHGSAGAFDLDDGGAWADDDDDNAQDDTNEDDDETTNDNDNSEKELALQKAKAAEKEKERLAKQLAEATGKADQAENVKMEGIDDGVLGQKWVENRLQEKGQWPPKLLEEDDEIRNMTFSQFPSSNTNTTKRFGLGKASSRAAVTAMEHSAVRRNLCMTMGRLNAQFLNTHPELVAAGPKGLIDPTYFKATLEFRQKIGILLEAALRIAMTARSHRLASTIIETVAMFKIGTLSPSDPETLQWFKTLMERTYDGEEGVPKLRVSSSAIETPGEDEVATGDVSALVLDVERVHAEKFTKHRLQVCASQGIPPEIAMQTYREGWWILIRCKRLDGDGDGDDDNDNNINNNDGNNNDELENNPILQALDAGAKKRFEAEKDEYRLLCAWPFIVGNAAQKSGKVKVRFQAPEQHGKYRFYVSIKSQEFLGCDQEFELEQVVLDKNELERKQAEEEGDNDENDEDDENDEPKKTK